MALYFFPNCINHHKPYLPINPNSNLNSNPFKSSLQFTSPASSTVPQRGLVRRRLFVVKNSGEDSAEISPQDEEVNSLGVKAALSVLRFYKMDISPLLPRSCRYVPTCSEYSMIAYKKYGFAKGSVLTVWRICRCNPLGGTGFDPPRWFDETTPTHEE